MYRLSSEHLSDGNAALMHPADESREPVMERAMPADAVPDSTIPEDSTAPSLRTARRRSSCWTAISRVRVTSLTLDSSDCFILARLCCCPVALPFSCPPQGPADMPSAGSGHVSAEEVLRVSQEEFLGTRHLPGEDCGLLPAEGIRIGQ